jgi:hypothetical protein
MDGVPCSRLLMLTVLGLADHRAIQEQAMAEIDPNVV